MKKRSLEKPRRFRFLRTILIFLILGAILNVAVAWGCVLISNYIDTEEHFSAISYAGRRHSTIQKKKFGCAIFILDGYLGDDTQSHRREFVNIVLSFDSASADNDDDYKMIITHESVQIFLQGWPLSSLWYSQTKFRTTDIHGAFTFSSPPYAILLLREFPHLLALNPIWFGFIYNTLFYATPLWLLFPGRYILRRWRRIRRGLCGKCGFVVSVNADLPHASPNCTECGTPIPGIVRPKA